MIELKKDEYHKALKELHKVEINNLFARAVVENHVSGKIYVDKLEEPSTFYVVHPYGMSLLFGRHYNKEFNQQFKEHALNTKRKRDTHIWMQAFPNIWHDELKTLFAECSIESSVNKSKNQTEQIIELNTRVNFKFNLKKFQNLAKKLRTPHTPAIRTSEKEFESMRGSVIPKNFWDNYDDFHKNGIGFSTYADSELGCTAFSSCIMDNFLELGMETVPEHRGKGLALYTCAQLIAYCLQHGHEPIWACSLANRGSYELAQKLGFEVSLQIPYYRLSK